MSELNNSTRLFKNVKTCKTLNWQEKAILSEIISYQLDGKPFKLKDITLAIELGMDKGTVSKFINRLHKKGLINKTTVSFPSLEGGKPKRLRTITVINIDQWTEKGKTAPTIKPIEKKTSTLETVVDVPVKQEPVSQPKQVKAEPTLEVKLNDVNAPQVQSKSEVLKLNIAKDITKNQYVYELIIDNMQKGTKYKFTPVIVVHSDKTETEDEAMQVPSMKIYALKSKLLKINPNLFD